MNKSDLAVLLAGASAHEVDQVHRLLHEWSVGPENSFPVQLAVLTRAQWRLAASIPRSLDDSRKWLELHLAEYQRQVKFTMDGFSSTTRQHQVEMRTSMDILAKNNEQNARQIQAHLADAEAVAGRVKSLMESAAHEWKGLQASTQTQCQQLQEISESLQDRFAWRMIIWWAAWMLVAFGLGYCLAANQFH